MKSNLIKLGSIYVLCYFLLFTLLSFLRPLVSNGDKKLIGFPIEFYGWGADCPVEVYGREINIRTCGDFVAGNLFLDLLIFLVTVASTAYLVGRIRYLINK